MEQKVSESITRIKESLSIDSTWMAAYSEVLGFCQDNALPGTEEFDILKHQAARLQEIRKEIITVIEELGKV